MEEYLEFAKSLAKEAGQIMHKYFQQGVEFRLKEDASYVTKADEEINDLVIQRVSERYPDHAVLGEESSKENNSSYTWSCDPIDGTVPFTKGIPISVFSLALVENGESVVGVVYDPFMDRMYSAVKGQGAFLNDKSISVSTVAALADATLNVEWAPEFAYDIDTALHNFSVDNQSYVLHLGSVTAASCLVAVGQYEACVFAGTKGKSVDIAAVKVIVEEAGGKVTDLFGNDLRFDVKDIKGAIISNKAIHDSVLDYTKDL